MTGEPYNPLEITNLGESIARVMLSSTPTPLQDVGSFRGAGIYALYYTGSLPMYRLLSEANQEGRFDQPIYVGKAVPEGARTGISVGTSATTTTLSSRIRQHRNSVSAAANLRTEDFQARWLVVESIWIPLGESLLISRFAPVWNGVVGGFGSNAAGVGRLAGMRSRWDSLHPGRAHADSLGQRTETADEIALDVEEYLRQRLQV